MSIVWLQQNHVKVRLKELNADKEACKAPAITVTCVETAQQTETAALSMEVNPQAPPSSDVPDHLMTPSLSAPLPKLRSLSTQGDSEGVQER